MRNTKQKPSRTALIQQLRTARRELLFAEKENRTLTACVSGQEKMTAEWMQASASLEAKVKKLEAQIAKASEKHDAMVDSARTMINSLLRTTENLSKVCAGEACADE